MDFEIYGLISPNGTREYYADENKILKKQEILNTVYVDEYKVEKIAYTVWNEELVEYINQKEYTKEDILAKICKALNEKLKLPKTLYKITSYIFNSEEYHYLYPLDGDFESYKNIQKLADEYFEGNVDEALSNEEYVFTPEDLYNWEKEDFFGKIHNENADIIDSIIELKEVSYQTYEICIDAVAKDYDALYYVIYQTDEICKIAVSNYGESLKYVENQTEEICKIALLENCEALDYIKNKTEEILKIAKEQNCYNK